MPIHTYMKKYSILIFLAAAMLLSSCGSKRTVPARILYTIRPDSNQLYLSSDSLFAFTWPNHTTLSSLKKHTANRKKKPVTSPGPYVPPGVAPGTIIKKQRIDVSSKYQGIDRVVYYDFTHRDVPPAFEGFRIVFASDLHYKSLFKKKELTELVRIVNNHFPDVFLMGGDYQEGCEYVPELFAELSKIRTRYGTFAVMGNNDYERCHDNIIAEMKRYGMHALEHRTDTVSIGKDRILISGVANPFDLKTNGVSPSLALSPGDFVVLLVHTPDYAEDVPVDNSDLILAGHTHGGQVCIFGYAPIIPSHYGSRFLTGLKYNTARIPMIVTNGLGTSNRDIRIGAPTEIIVITLHRLKSAK